MLPWFIYLLIQLGYLVQPEQWHSLSTSEQNRLEIIIEETVPSQQ